jgi:hypothetical protein
MKTRYLTIASTVGALCIAASSQAVVIAGWDFSQHQLPASAVGGGSPLPANYASLDPNGAGAESAIFGEATYNDSVLLPNAGIGANCEITGSQGTEGCAPPNVDGPIRSNRSEGFELGKSSFDAFSILRDEGQAYATRYGMTATGNVDVVLKAISGYNGGASNWVVSFGGRMLTGTASTVDVAFSSDGVSYTNYGPVNLTVDDERYEVALDAAAHPVGYVRLTLDAATGQPLIDNVAVEATPIPEPAATAQLLAGVACLAGLYLRRR